ncbi:MAG: PEGA domain-containing protein [Chitinivibrionales bacterium]|nr:PEGA domain-containing protein [Chitinivibrionales bacterium]
MYYRYCNRQDATFYISIEHSAGNKTAHKAAVKQSFKQLNYEKENSMNKGIILICLLIISNSLTATAASKSSHLSIKVAPNTALITINEKKAGKGEVKSYRVPSGTVAIVISDDNFETLDTTITIKGNEKKAIELTLVTSPSTIDVITDPLGASVYLNKKMVGKTPYSEKRFKPGHYVMNIEMPGYKSIEEAFYLPPSDAAEFTFDLEHTQAWVDSVKAARIALKKRHQFIRRIAFSSLAAAFAGTGVYFNSRMQNRIDGYKDAAEAYDKTSNNFVSYKEDYYTHRDKARDESVKRNIAYGISSVCVLGLGISFLF